LNSQSPDLLQYLMRRPIKVLDMACGDGRLGQILKLQWPDATVFGMDTQSPALELARNGLDQVWARPSVLDDAFFQAAGIQPGAFDTLLLVDVLPRLQNPWGFLKWITRFLAPEAQVLVRTANVRNLALLQELERGQWSYADSGLLAAEHLRFYTPQSVERLLTETGYQVLQCVPVRDRRLAQVPISPGAMQVQVGNISIGGLLPETLSQWAASEVVLTALRHGAACVDSGLGVPVVQADTQQVAVSVLSTPRVEDVWRIQQSLRPMERQWMEECPLAVRFHVILRLTIRNVLLAQKSMDSLLRQIHPATRVTVLREYADYSVLWPKMPDYWTVIEDKAWAALRNAVITQDEWVVFVDAGDRLTEDALYRLAVSIEAHPQWRMAYSDEETMSDGDWPATPHCKPDLWVDTLRSIPYVGGCLTLRGDFWHALGGISEDHAGVEDYDLVLRAVERVIDAPQSTIGHVARVLYQRSPHSGDGDLDAGVIVENGRNALVAHLERCGEAAEVEHGPFPATYRCLYELSTEPLVSIFIPTRNQLPYLAACVESIIDKTEWPLYEIIIIDNDSDEVATVRYLEGVEQAQAQLEERIRVFRYPGEFNYSAMHNAAVLAEARGDVLLFLNNDTAVLQPQWLRNMLRHAVRPQVGAVGAKLLFPDGRVQHAGVVLGLGGRAADHVFMGEAKDARGYYGRLVTTQNYEAVTAACLMVRKNAFQSVGGFDENLPNQFNDVDFCLKLSALGLRQVWTPDVILLHHGSATQKALLAGQSAEVTQDAQLRMDKASARIYQHWPENMAHDRAYNANLSRAGRGFELENRISCLWQADWHPRKRAITHAVNREGTGEYRIIAPGRALAQGGRLQVDETMTLLRPPEMLEIAPDVVVFQLQLEHHQLQYLKEWETFSRDTLRVFEVDDLIVHVPMKNAHRQHLHKDLTGRLREAAKHFQRMTVTTEPLVAAYKGMCSDIRVVPNYVERARWGQHRTRPNREGRPRVGWAGGVSHQGDLEIIADVVKATYKEIEWVFMGMCPDAMRPYVTFVPPVPLDQYPQKLVSLGLELGVAPLEIHPFNEAKSHLRILEYGILAIPIVCTDIFPYQGFPVKRVKNRFMDWRNAIMEAVVDRDALQVAGEQLRAHVETHWMLEDHLDVWESAWT
jgi:GT2 family glycosyltransferase/2-polyprenyl-3-methyl-5-hydroxy-6-metoxy-1,4-benzoquinol methylase